LYQDFAIGLQGVKADGKVLRYSDWTVTLDWDGKLQATLGQGLPYVYFTAPNSGGATIQLVTNPKKDADNNIVNVQILAFANGKGDPVTSGSGPLRLQIKYDITDAADKEHPQHIDHQYGLFLPSGTVWQLSGNSNGTLTFNVTSAKNYFSVATLPDASSQTFD